MAKKKTAGRRKKIPLAEFKAWLEGVEELQSDDWSPSYEQWTLIRSKIDSIIENAPVPVAAAPVAQAPQMQPQMRPGLPLPPQMQPQMPQMPQGPVGADGQPIAIPQVGDTTPPVVPTNNPMLNPSNAPGGTSAPMTKTPELDNSDGNYTSSFT